MNTCAFITFGCKVNQYDTQAIRLEGYSDTYVTCLIDGPDRLKRTRIRIQVLEARHDHLLAVPLQESSVQSIVHSSGYKPHASGRKLTGHKLQVVATT